MGTPLPCPRCREPLEPFDRPRADRVVPADMCLSCGGLWLERGALDPELAAALPGASRDAGFSQIDCPRCGGPLGAFVLEGIALDTCAPCGGLWIDGAELLDLDLALPKLRAAESAGTYRSGPGVSGLARASMLCPGCAREVPRDELAESPQGLRCRLCAADLRDPLEVPTGPLTRALRALGSFFRGRAAGD